MWQKRNVTWRYIRVTFELGVRWCSNKNDTFMCPGVEIRPENGLKGAKSIRGLPRYDAQAQIKGCSGTIRYCSP